MIFMTPQRALPAHLSIFGPGGAMSLSCPPSGRAAACFAGEGGFSGGQRGACPPVEAKRTSRRLDHVRCHWGDCSGSARHSLPTPLSTTLPFVPDQGRTALVIRSFSAKMALSPLTSSGRTPQRFTAKQGNIEKTTSLINAARYRVGQIWRKQWLVSAT